MPDPMKLITNFQSAKELAARTVPFFHSGTAAGESSSSKTGKVLRSVIGRKYKGVFDDNDGSYITVTNDERGLTQIDRDSFGSIPLFYSTVHPFISTDIRLLAEIEKPELDFEALAEYLSTSYLTGGRTIYRNLRCLMPNETISVSANIVTANAKNIFSNQDAAIDKHAGELLEAAIDNSIKEMLERYSEDIALNLSGGADSTLLLAKMREKDPGRKIVSTTYFHDDWRDDLNDWEYAEQAASKFGSRHRLLKLYNESFCQAHRELMGRSKNVFHTYAAAFYAQNKITAALGRALPIVNGSGPDESIIGTEKISIAALMALQSLKREDWVEYLTAKIEYVKIPEDAVMGMLRAPSEGFVRSRREIAETLLDAPNFLEFQRRFHAITILQNHIHELTAAAQALDRRILFPYLTNDIFKIIFSSRFETLNADGNYKSVIKRILEKHMPSEFVHRKKIGFQSPSRPYFMSDVGFGRELSRLLSKGKSAVLNFAIVESGIRERLNAELDVRRRYDFLEWTVYNILLLEEIRGICG
jgi:asparagine synthetase B (glutamine-hydrolysing)